jgi:hypothetical protein
MPFLRGRAVFVVNFVANFVDEVDDKVDDEVGLRA